jgi:hypothetical protein
VLANRRRKLQRAIENRTMIAALREGAPVQEKFEVAQLSISIRLA